MRSSPRATVSSTMGRAERWSSKKWLSASGLYFGSSCISRRQPTSARLRSATKTSRWGAGPRPAAGSQPAWTFVTAQGGLRSRRRLRACTPGSDRLFLNFGHLERSQLQQEKLRLFAVELRVIGFDAQEKAVLRSAVEGRIVEHRMIRLRQPVHGEH